jgi:hypothetical protein
VVVVPAPEDLIELRAAILGEGVERDRAPRVIRACAPFSLSSAVSRSAVASASTPPSARTS